MAELTQARLKEVLNYDPETGIFLRIKTINSRAKIGGKVGCLNRSGYYVISIDYELHYLHRLAWVFMYGYWPSNQIDHINGVKSDNRIANLREVTNKQNTRNSKIKKSNKSGYKGVSWSKIAGKWHAQITVEGSNNHLGYFDVAEEAHKVYCEAAHRYFGEFARFK